MNVAIQLNELYEIDDHQWLLETIELLKQKNFTKLDVENLIEELEYLARKDKATVKSLLQQLMIHILLLQYWTNEYEKNKNHWQSEVLTFRDQLQDRLTTNLKNYLIEEMDTIYKRALKQVQIKTDYQVNFPQDSPYTLEQLLSETFLP
jgi:hypothetical protein